MYIHNSLDLSFEIACCQDRDVVCIVGQNVFKMCKLIEGNLKPFGFLKGDGLCCLDHAWLSNKHVLVAGDAGKIYLFEEAELKSVYNLNDLLSETEPEPTDDGNESTSTQKRK